MTAADDDAAATEPAQGRRPSSRSALVEAAYLEFTEKGYEAATVSSIAERAGVTTGALYAHFPGKLDLLLEALGISPASVMYADLAAMATRPWPDVLRELGSTIAADPDPSALLLLDAIVAARRDPKVAAVLRAGMVAYEAALVRATEGGIAIGLLDPALPADDLARLVNLLSLGRLVAAALDVSTPSTDALARLANLLLVSSGASDDVDASAAIALVRSRARRLERDRLDLADSVAAAVDEGHSLRQVGAAAGVSHERVRQMIRERHA